MSAGADISVTPKGGGAYRVDVRSGGSTTTHEVEVPQGFAAELGWAGDKEPDLVRESFVFLLEREPPGSILRGFKLDVIERYFGDYPAEIRRRNPG